jgi:hypothetical protein
LNGRVRASIVNGGAVWAEVGFFSGLGLWVVCGLNMRAAEKNERPMLRRGVGLGALREPFPLRVNVRDVKKRKKTS